VTQDRGVLLREATASDVPALSELHVRTFRETHGGGPDAALRERQWNAKFSSGQLLFCLVLECPPGELIGFASGERHTGDELTEFQGELNKIYLLREFQGRGLGRRLLCAAGYRFKACGVDSILLFGDAESSSNGFYEAMGGERLYTSRGEFHGGYGWRDLTGLAASCADSADHGSIPQSGRTA
jgi:ribosomal protein S18 acetylase RimI-like enzyme